jgi:hypothetical protein
MNNSAVVAPSVPSLEPANANLIQTDGAAHPRTEASKEYITDRFEKLRIGSSCDDFALLLGSGLYFVAGPANIDPGTEAEQGLSHCSIAIV